MRDVAIPLMVLAVGGAAFAARAVALDLPVAALTATIVVVTVGATMVAMLLGGVVNHGYGGPLTGLIRVAAVQSWVWLAALLGPLGLVASPVILVVLVDRLFDIEPEDVGLLALVLGIANLLGGMTWVVATSLG